MLAHLKVGSEGPQTAVIIIKNLCFARNDKREKDRMRTENMALIVGI